MDCIQQALEAKRQLNFYGKFHLINDLDSSICPKVISARWHPSLHTCKLNIAIRRRAVEVCTLCVMFTQNYVQGTLLWSSHKAFKNSYIPELVLYIFTQTCLNSIVTCCYFYRLLLHLMNKMEDEFFLFIIFFFLKFNLCFILYLMSSVETSFQYGSY